MAGMHLRFHISPQCFLEELTEAAYQTALKHRAGTSFVELELELWDTLREVIRKNMLVSEACGKNKLCKCKEVGEMEPWSKEAESLGLGSGTLHER